jgi:hypothetical protein
LKIRLICGTLVPLVRCENAVFRDALATGEPIAATVIPALLFSGWASPKSTPSLVFSQLRAMPNAPLGIAGLTSAVAGSGVCPVHSNRG